MNNVLSVDFAPGATPAAAASIETDDGDGDQTITVADLDVAASPEVNEPDTYAYDTAADSLATARDTILNFGVNDVLDFSGVDAALGNTLDTFVDVGLVGSFATFEAQLATNGFGGADFLVATDGVDTRVYVDAAGDGLDAFTGGDTVVNLVGYNGAFTAANLIGE